MTAGVAGLAILITAASAEARKIGTCNIPRGAKIQALSSTAVAYKIEPYDADGEMDGDAYGCRRHIGRTLHLTTTWDYIEEWDYAVRFKLAGRFVGWIEEGATHYPDSEYDVVHSFDLKSGRERWYSYPFRGGGVSVMVLAPTGAFAYSTSYSDTADGETRGIEIRDSTGDHIVDQGPGIDLNSLRRHGLTVLWTDAGEQRSYRLQ